MKLRKGKTKSKEMKQKLYFGQKKNKGKTKNKTLTHEALNFSNILAHLELRTIYQMMILSP